MTISFNLVDDPWIPCIATDGSCKELGVLEVLSRAHEIRSIETNDTLVTASVYRLLLAILHRNFDTSSIARWEKLWEAGSWDAATLQEYFSNWGRRFDLFDPVHPFYQMADERVEKQSVAKLYPGMAASSFFNHPVQKEDLSLTPAEAARQLLVSQTFGLAGICHPQKKLFYNSAPWLVGMVFFVEGGTLFQTLALNLLRYDDHNPQPDLALSTFDQPAWEMDDPFAPPRETPNGYLDYLTWQNRKILLLPEVIGGQVVVRQMTSAPGLRLQTSFLDPMKGYKRNKDKGWMPLFLNENRALWRDSTVLLQIHRLNDFIPPQAVSWVATLSSRNVIPQSTRYRLVSYGVSSDQAKINLARRERIPLPLTYLESEDMLGYLDICMSIAEDVRNTLYGAIYQLATFILSPTADLPDGRKPDAKDIEQLIAHWSAERGYWSNLEPKFLEIVDLLTHSDADQIIQQWRKIAVNAGRDALLHTASLCGESVDAMKAIIMAQNIYFDSLRKKKFFESAIGETPGKGV